MTSDLLAGEPLRCRFCGGRCEHYDPTGDGLAEFWSHEHHPADEHDAKPLRVWPAGEVAPADCTAYERTLHYILHGSLVVEVPTSPPEP